MSAKRNSLCPCAQPVNPDALGENESVAISRTPDREGIMGSIKDFLGKGR